MRCCRRLSLVGFYGGTGLAGELNPLSAARTRPTLPTNFWGAFDNAFNNSSPDYFVGSEPEYPDS